MSQKNKKEIRAQIYDYLYEKHNIRAGMDGKLKKLLKELGYSLEDEEREEKERLNIEAKAKSKANPRSHNIHRPSYKPQRQRVAPVIVRTWRPEDDEQRSKWS